MVWHSPDVALELAVWAAAAIAFPLQLILNQVSAAELLAYIGLAGALLALGDHIIGDEPVKMQAFAVHAALRSASITIPASVLLLVPFS
jgi:hypothetical protein